MAEADPWLTLSEAAARTGRHISAVRSLVRRRKLPARKGNNGQWLVQLPEALAQPDLGHDAGSDTALTELLAEVTELREALAEARAEAKAAHDIAVAQVDAAKAQAVAGRQLAERLTQELADVRRELAETRMPWLLRLVLALRG